MMDRIKRTSKMGVSMTSLLELRAPSGEHADTGGTCSVSGDAESSHVACSPLMPGAWRQGESWRAAVMGLDGCLQLVTEHDLAFGDILRQLDTL